MDVYSRTAYIYPNNRRSRRIRRRYLEEQILIRKRRQKRLLRSRGDESTGLGLIPQGPAGIVTGTGERAFPEIFGFPLDVLGQFVGEIIHTYNATWEWTGFVWRQKIFP